MNRLNLICRTALPLLLSLSAAATAAQETGAPTPAADGEAQVGFSADRLEYDQNSEQVTASGEVRMTRAGYDLRANTVTWNRITGEVRAVGSVRVINSEGDVA